jgi:hypothetical protein
MDIFSPPVSYSRMSGVKLLVEEADNSPESCSEVKNTGSDPYKSKYDFSHCSNRTFGFIKLKSFSVFRHSPREIKKT